MNKKPYITPMLVTVEFRSERGYAVSGIIGVPEVDMLELLYYQEGSNQEMEPFNNHGTWTEGSNGFWEEPDGHF